MIDGDPSRSAALARALEDRLTDAGLVVIDPAERLRGYQAVENTYLSTFQALGALGLVLGTLGLGAVVIRNILERRRETALLTAVGYRPRQPAPARRRRGRPDHRRRRRRGSSRRADRGPAGGRATGRRAAADRDRRRRGGGGGVRAARDDHRHRRGRPAAAARIAQGRIGRHRRSIVIDRSFGTVARGARARSRPCRCRRSNGPDGVAAAAPRSAPRRCRPRSPPRPPTSGRCRSASATPRRSSTASASTCSRARASRRSRRRSISPPARRCGARPTISRTR